LRAFALLLACSFALAAQSYPRWSKIELTFEGPAMKGLGSPNPFAVPFDVVFTGPAGKPVRVPGFYDGDGRGGLDGGVWKVRFAADRNGKWRWETRSAEPKLSGRRGELTVIDPPAGASGLFRKGRLEYVGQRYLKFREGGYWIKAGADDPENILGKAFGNWENKKRELDYIAAKNINSIYVMTHTLDGDGKDVWPWVGATAEEAKRNDGRFDVAKLERWRDFFEHAQNRGLVIHLVLEDDSAWIAYDHARYYREIVARFGYLPALYFNFCEEYNERYSLADALRYLKLLGEIDPYGHPRAIHNVRAPADTYIDSAEVQMSSIQTNPKSPAALNQLAVEWWQASLVRSRRPLVVSFDEARPAEDRRSWWSVFLGGAVWESYIPVDRGYAAAEPAWTELAAARRFMESLPVERMFPANHLAREGKAFCLAAPGEVYALYLPEGGAMRLELTAGNQYQARWFDPRASEAQAWRQAPTPRDGRFTAPDAQDWGLVVRKTAGSGKPDPVAVSGQLRSARGEPVRFRLATAGAAPGGDYRIITSPKHGTLTGDGPERVYTPSQGFTGRDRLEWRAGASNLASIDIVASASGRNAAPSVENQVLQARPGTSAKVILLYADEDGPGPYEIRVVRKPAHGTLAGMDNDITYTPAPGYTGEDSFEWLVSDGEARSPRATVKVRVEN
jgi:hypothetical protein